MAMGLAMFLPCKDGAVPCGASAITTAGVHSSSKRQQQGLGSGDRSEHLQHKITQAVAVPIQRGDDHSVAGVGQQQSIGSVDQFAVRKSHPDSAWPLRPFLP